MKEIWKDIPGFEGYYQVSNCGRVRSQSRTIINSDNQLFLKERMRKLKKSKEGYLEGISWRHI